MMDTQKDKVNYRTAVKWPSKMREKKDLSWILCFLHTVGNGQTDRQTIHFNYIVALLIISILQSKIDPNID